MDDLLHDRCAPEKWNEHRSMGQFWAAFPGRRSRVGDPKSGPWRSASDPWPLVLDGQRRCGAMEEEQDGHGHSSDFADFKIPGLFLIMSFQIFADAFGVAANCSCVKEASQITVTRIVLQP